MIGTWQDQSACCLILSNPGGANFRKQEVYFRVLIGGTDRQNFYTKGYISKWYHTVPSPLELHVV